MMRKTLLPMVLVTALAAPAHAQLPPPYPPPPMPATSASCLALPGMPCQFTASTGQTPYYPLVNPNDPGGGVYYGFLYWSGVYGVATNVNVHTDGPVTWAPGEGGGSCPLDYHLDTAQGFHLVYFCVGDVYTVTVEAGAVLVGAHA